MLSDMDDDPVDVDFLAWAKANALPNDREAWARALGNSKQQSRRRLIRTEFSHKWISTCVATLMERYGCKKDPAVVQATTEFHVAERTVWNALSLYAYRTLRENRSHRYCSTISRLPREAVIYCLG